MIRPFDDVFEEPEAFDFFAILRRIEAATADRPRIGENRSKREETVRLGQDPFFAFPTSNLSRAARLPNGVPALYVRFLGLLGPQGALPLSTTDEAFGYSLSGDDAFARFLDLLNDRFLKLFFRAWANARAAVDRDRPANRKFDAYAGAPVGVGTTAVRGRGGTPDEIKVAYAGLLGPAAKSASRLRDLVAGAFGAEVEVVEFVPSRTTVEAGERTRLGAAYATLGVDALAGASVLDVQDKIRIVVHAPTLERYRDYLPNGRFAKPLAEIVFFYLGHEIAWDVELALPVGEAKPAKLGESGELGWTSWLAPNWSAAAGTKLRDARFDLSGLAAKG